MTGGRLAPRFRGMTAAERAAMADALAHLTADGPAVTDRHGATWRPMRDTRTGAPRVTVSTPWRAGRILSAPGAGWDTGHWSGGPDHDDTARQAAKAYAVPMRAKLIGRWDIEGDGTLSVYALTDTAEAPRLARRTVAVHADGARCARATDTADCPRSHEYLTEAEAAERGAL